MTDAASEIRGKEVAGKKPWVIRDVLDLCDEKLVLKEKRYKKKEQKNTGKQTVGFKRQRRKQRRTRQVLNARKEIKTCLNKNNKRAYQMVKDLTSEKQDRSSASQSSLENVLLKNKRFSADGQTIAQNCTPTIVVVTTQCWRTQPPEEDLCNWSSVRKLRLQ